MNNLRTFEEWSLKNLFRKKSQKVRTSDEEYQRIKRDYFPGFRRVLDTYVKDLDIDNFIKFSNIVKKEYPEFYEEYLTSRKKLFKDNQGYQGVLDAINMPFFSLKTNEKIDLFKLKYSKWNIFKQPYFDEKTKRIIVNSDFVKYRKFLDYHLKNLDVVNFYKSAKIIKNQDPEFFEEYLKARKDHFKEGLDSLIKKLDIDRFIEYAKMIKEIYPEFYEEYIKSRKELFKNNQDYLGVLDAINVPFLF